LTIWIFDDIMKITLDLACFVGKNL